MTQLDHKALVSRLSEIRRHLHSIPELGLEEVKTSGYIASVLEEWGFEVTRGLAKTGLVASLQKGNGVRSIGFRADFDALPILEEGDLPYKSTHHGLMHACGHDGHTAMLLGAAWLLKNDASFSGTVHFIFQPAEENYGGGRIMIEDGLLEKFPCQQVFALHNWPGLPAGVFSSKPGPMAASIDAAIVRLTGRGGHGAEPEKTVDPVVVGSGIVMNLQTLVSRSISPHSASVVTVGAFNAGSVSNVIPDTATLKLSVRATDPSVRDVLLKRVEQIINLQAESFGASTEIEWETGYPATINNAEAVKQVESTVNRHFGGDAFVMRETPFMGSEDFSFFLENVPGAYVLIGNGDSGNLHTPRYDFNDDILERGALFFKYLAEDLLHEQAVVPS